MLLYELWAVLAVKRLKTGKYYICIVALVSAPEHHTELQGLFTVDFFIG